jgi:hypothetical protein
LGFLFPVLDNESPPPTKQNQNKKVPKLEDQKKVKGARRKEKGTREKVKGKSAVKVRRPKTEVGGRTDKPTANSQRLRANSQ